MYTHHASVRCFAERIGDQWQAFCIDLNLAAQADSLPAAIVKLDAMIREYLFDATHGEDSAHAAALIPRPAPFSLRLRYLLCRLLGPHRRSAKKWRHLLKA